MRFGIGYDVHKFIENKDLFLGGAKIDFPLGLEGHSDADVVLHSLMDAILGAAALRDIGHHFPDNDVQYKGIDSMILLNKVCNLLEREGYRVNNIDISILCQKPRLATYIPTMIEKIAKCLKIPNGAINIKATTTEGLGFVGRREGIAVMSIASIVNVDR